MNLRIVTLAIVFLPARAGDLKRPGSLESLKSHRADNAGHDQKDVVEGDDNMVRVGLRRGLAH
jgi:hypothetical protein